MLHVYNILLYIAVDSMFQTSMKPLKFFFVSLLTSIVPLIANSIPSLNVLKLFLERAYIEMKPQLAHAETVDDVLILVIEKCSLINVSCLEVVIDHYDIRTAKEELLLYMATVEKFCEETTVSQCIDESFSLRLSSSQLLTCDTVQFTPKNNACSLSEIKNIKEHLFDHFANKVLIQSIAIYKEFITVTCYAPQYVRDSLQIESVKIASTSLREQVQMMCISGNNVFSYDTSTNEDNVSIMKFYFTLINF